MKKVLLPLLLVASLAPFLSHMVAADLTNQTKWAKFGTVPPEGFVPDAKTAVKVAEAVIEPVYGLQTVRNERPFKARLVDGEWFVKGSHTTNINVFAGVSEVHISKTNGCITFLFHWK
jgi:hypothetical protein